MDEQLFELIRITIGKQNNLSRILSPDEWLGVYELSQKHAIAGVIYASVSRLKQNGLNIPPDLYWQWLGLTTQIHQRNEVLNFCCIEALSRLKQEGFKA